MVDKIDNDDSFLNKCY